MKKLFFRSVRRPCFLVIKIACPVFLCLLAISAGESTISSGHTGPKIVGTVSSLYGAEFVNVRTRPSLAAPIVERLHPSTTVDIVKSVVGSSVSGVDVWYEVQVRGHVGFLVSSSIAVVTDRHPWTGQLIVPDLSSVTVATRAAPNTTAASDASFTVGSKLTVVGMVSGQSIDGRNSRWYLVVTGAYRPSYIYSENIIYLGPGATSPAQPSVTAAAAVALDAMTGKLLMSLHPTDRRAPASLVKLMTAAVVLDRLSLDTIVTVPAGVQAVGIDIGGSSMGLGPGERLAVRDLLFGMLLPSGNDAAYTLSQAVAGSQTAFAQLMNRKARTLGLRDTRFVQGYGLDNPMQYSSALDLARLARYALAHYPYLRSVVTTIQHSIGQGATHPAFDLHNTNKLLGVYPGVYGVKTGTTPAAGENLIAAAHRYKHSLIVVVLGSNDRFADATALLNFAGLVVSKNK